MNLHIVSDNVFINKFVDNLKEIGILGDNRIIARTNNKALRFVKRDIPFAQLYSSSFNSLVGDTSQYKKVFIHQFTPLLYRWVARNQFRELNWMVWGSDLYNLPDFERRFYEEITLNRFISRQFSLKKFLYKAKVSVLHDRFRRSAYEKVDNLLTWMPSEFEFALDNVEGLRARHQFFFYENDLPYQAMENLSPEKSAATRPLFILGNSSTPELNHLDAIEEMNAANVKADLLIPASYGDHRYRAFLKENIQAYRGGDVRLLEKYMPFEEYLKLVASADGLIMNNIRPQGYGNILMMMYLGKRIFLNPRNISIPDLERWGFAWQPFQKISDASNVDWHANKKKVSGLLSHETLLKTYGALFT